VTALGDEVNEAARIQQSARHGRVLGSKALLERLTVDGPTEMGIDPARLEYEPLESLEGVTEKAIRDAGHLAVVDLHEHLGRAALA